MILKKSARRLTSIASMKNLFTQHVRVRALARASTDSRGQCVIESMCDVVTARASAASGDIPGAFGDIPGDFGGYPQPVFGDIPGAFGDIPGDFWGYPQAVFGDIPSHSVGISPNAFWPFSREISETAGDIPEDVLGISPRIFWGYPQNLGGDIPKNLGISPIAFRRFVRDVPQILGISPKRGSAGISPKTVWGYPQKVGGDIPKIFRGYPRKLGRGCPRKVLSFTHGVTV